MHIKPIVVVFASLSVVTGLFLAFLFRVGPLDTLRSVHAQAATQEATDTAQADASATALVTDFKLSNLYQDALFTVNYPEHWVTQAGPNAVSLVSEQPVIALIQKFGIPTLAPGQIFIAIMNGVIDAELKPGVGSAIVNINCTSCHVLGEPTALKSGRETQSASAIALPLADVARSIMQEYSRAPLNCTFAKVQPFLGGVVEGVEATFTAHPNDGLLIVFYANGQLVNVVVTVPSGELPKDQPLIEAIVSTIRSSSADSATPAATATDHR